MSINGKTKIVGILGDPVTHSFSPRMHNSAFQRLGLDYCYIPLGVAVSNLAKALEGFRAWNFCGANVTIPHKEAVLPFLDYLEPISEKSGSVNTLFWDENKGLCGTSTDPYGALKNLEENGFSLRDQTILLLGYGGSARAIAFELALNHPDIKVVFSGRSPEKAQILIDEINSKCNSCYSFANSDEVHSRKSEFDLILNTTPLGMESTLDKMPIDSSIIESHHFVYDIIYTPAKTRLLIEAEKRGCTILNGLGMLVYQGAKSFEIWTGKPAPVDVMFQTLENQK